MRALCLAPSAWSAWSSQSAPGVSDLGCDCSQGQPAKVEQSDSDASLQRAQHITPGAATPHYAAAHNPAQYRPTAQPACRARCAAQCRAGRSPGRIAGAPLRRRGLQADRSCLSVSPYLTVTERSPHGDRTLCERKPSRFRAKRCLAARFCFFVRKIVCKYYVI